MPAGLATRWRAALPISTLLQDPNKTTMVNGKMPRLRLFCESAAEVRRQVLDAWRSCACVQVLCGIALVAAVSAVPVELGSSYISVGHAPALTIAHAPLAVAHAPIAVAHAPTIIKAEPIVSANQNQIHIVTTWI